MEDLIEKIEKLKNEKCSNYRNSSLIEKYCDDYYKFVPLEETKNQNRDGFIIYSSESTKNCNKELQRLYDQSYDNIHEPYIYRYYYYEKLNSFPLHATVIMMNPAFADSENDDDTIKNIKKYLNNEYNKFGSFEILNLYPVRMPKSPKLKKFLEKTKEQTDNYQKFVKEFLQETCKKHVIIAAWGSRKEENKTAQELFLQSWLFDTKYFDLAFVTELKCMLEGVFEGIRMTDFCLKLKNILNDEKFKCNTEIKSLQYNKKKYPDRLGWMITSLDLKNRYYYCEKFQDKIQDNEILSIIMYNPSFANPDKPDPTINNIWNIVKEKTSYKAFEIFNIYTIRDSDPKITTSQNLDINIDLFKEIIKARKPQNVLLAWGNLIENDLKNNKLKEDIYDLFKNQNNLMAVGINKLNNRTNPTHLSPQNNSKLNNHRKLIPIKLDNNLCVSIVE